MKKYLAAAAFISMSFHVEDSIFEAYTQKIPGTQVTFDMTPIPAGTFQMGSNMSTENDQKPAHEVKLDAFWMGTHEVTWDAFELFLDKNYELMISEEPIGTVRDPLQTSEGWSKFAAGWTVGGLSGVAWGYVCTQILPYYQ